MNKFLTLSGVTFTLLLLTGKADAVPFTFTFDASNPFDQRANDFHVLLAGTGGTLANPALVSNAPGAEAPTTLNASFNQVNIAWQEKPGNGVERGESIKFSVQSDFSPIVPVSFTWTFNGADLGTVWRWNNHEYALIPQAGLSWNDAKLGAAERGDGWHLATITSQGEQDFIASTLVTGKTGQYFLGGFQDPSAAAVDQGWQWVTGEPWSYTDWFSGFNSLVGANVTEPNDFNSSNPNERLENHVEDHLSVWGLYGWKWNDTFSGAQGSETSGYIIERAVPEPSTISLIGIGMLALLYRRISRRTTLQPA